MTITPEEVVKRHMGLAKTIANKSSNWTHPYPDMLQECLVELWRTAERYPGQTLDGGLASKCMRARMHSLHAPGSSGEPWLGSPRVSSGGRAYEALSGEAIYYEGFMREDTAEESYLDVIAPLEASAEEACLERLPGKVAQIIRDYAEEIDARPELCTGAASGRFSRTLYAMLEGRSATDVATQEGVTRQTVSNRMRKFRKELQERLEDVAA